MKKLNEHQEADLEVYTREMMRLMGERAVVEVSFSVNVACTVVVNVQLALRHPENTGEAHAVGRKWCDRVIDAIEAQSPALARILRKGYDPADDA